MPDIGERPKLPARSRSERLCRQYGCAAPAAPRTISVAFSAWGPKWISDYDTDYETNRELPYNLSSSVGVCSGVICEFGVFRLRDIETGRVALTWRARSMCAPTLTTAVLTAARTNAGTRASMTT